jgi:hypothetical protein
MRFFTGSRKSRDCAEANTRSGAMKYREQRSKTLKRNFVIILMLTVVVVFSMNELAHASAVISGGFDSNSLSGNDDQSTILVSIGFPVNFFGSMYTDLYVNNNGNITFATSLGTYTPFGLTTNIGTSIIAPFFADVDTRLGNIVTYGQGTFQGRKSFGVNWINVGYYSEHTDKLNNFQLILVDRSDISTGDFDIIFNYDKIQWETGDASGGSNGFGGQSARIGYSNGTGNFGTFLELPGSGTNGAFLDSGPYALISHSNVGLNGRYIFRVRNGIPPVSRRNSICTHWYNWANTFSFYEQVVKNFPFVRDGAWWTNLEPQDFTSNSAWDGAYWSYPYNVTLQNCNQTITYESGYDNLVKKFQAIDSPALLMLLNTHNPNLSSSPNNINYTQYYDYVYHIVSRYNMQSASAMPGLSRSIKYFEIGNEVDNPVLNDGITLSNYVNNRLIPAYRAAKQANSESKILNAGLYLGGDTGFDVTYLDNMLNVLKQNGGESNNYYTDILSIHYYYHPQDPENFLANIDNLKQVLSKYNLSTKPIWITEYGIATKNDSGGQIREKDQAAVLLRFNCLMKYSNIDNSFIYNLKDVNSSNPTWENTYGIYKVLCNGGTEDIQSKEAILVLENYYSKINGLNKVTLNSQSERNTGIYIVTFSNGSKNVNVIWYTKMNGTGINPDYASESSTIKIQLYGKNGVLSDMYGNVLNENLSNGASITIGEKPIYIESTRKLSIILPVLHLLLQPSG